MESDHDLLLPPVSEENICLPLSVNAVARYWNVDLPISEAAEIARKYPSVNGSILIEGVEIAERHGLSCVILRSSLAGLKEAIDCGIPPIVILPGVQGTIQHASVISGYDTIEGTILHYIPQASGSGEFQVGVIPEERFDGMWSEDGRLMVLVAPHEALSGVTVPPEDALRSSRLCFESEKQNLLGHHSGAIDSLREAISLDGSNHTAYSLLAGILNEQNSPECVRYYEEAISLNNRSYLAHRGLGNCHLKARRFADAEACYSRAILINPSRYGPIYKNRGIARLEQGNGAGAREDLETYLKLMPNAPDRPSISAAMREM